MKLRTRENTLRLRLMRHEVESIKHGESVIEETQFPNGGKLRCALVPAQDQSAALISDAEGVLIEIRVPAQAALDWACTEAVGLGGDEALTIGPLQVLIEKDFTCITPRQGEEELDTYPNPNAAQV